ncbi:MAG: hypothetical protein R3B70_26355 [Polyangiaceae bacterium]
MRVFLAGEGPDDLGDWYHPPQYRKDPPQTGIIEALLRRVAAHDFTVIAARPWKAIRKYRLRPPRRPEVQNVLGLMLEADEARSDFLIFVRDQDGDTDRQAHIDEGLRLAREGSFSPTPIGAVAIQEIEAWLLALLGERRSEQLSDPKTGLKERHGVADRPAKVAIVEGASLDTLPDDARSLRTFLDEVLASFVQGS